MQIRNKLLLATAIPIALLIVQVLLVNVFIRELQLAVQFIGSAQTVIEADLVAKDRLEALRKQIKKVPQIYVQSNNTPSLISPTWDDISRQIEIIELSSVIASVNKDAFTSVQLSFKQADKEINDLIQTMADASPGMNTLLVRAISTDSALGDLDNALAGLAIELRQQLQQAVDREREIHDRPIIAGVVIGGLAVLLLMMLVWAFVDRGIIRRLTSLSQSMLAIADGDLHANIPAKQSNDEIGNMSEALTVFQNNAIEIQENNRREVIQKRKQRQFWLEHMATFLRHEVKNKQVGAEQSIRLLASKEGNNPLVSKYCDRATSSLVEMKELINSTVDAADIESALISEDFSALDLPELLRQYARKINEQLDANVVCINESKERCFVRGDEHRLEQMLDKLVSNAMDFRYSGTEVTIRLARYGDDQVSISVENTGPALQKDTHALFGLSYSLRSPTNKQQGNVGFGLFVARRIAEYHNGTIEASNTESGAAFTVYLPVYSDS